MICHVIVSLKGTKQSVGPVSLFINNPHRAEASAEGAQASTQLCTEFPLWCCRVFGQGSIPQHIISGNNAVHSLHEAKSDLHRPGNVVRPGDPHTQPAARWNELLSAGYVERISYLAPTILLTHLKGFGRRLSQSSSQLAISRYWSSAAYLGAR